MGRNKILIQKIKDERIRNITYIKRKKGLLKKAMELCLLCDADILLSVYPKNLIDNQLLIFCTNSNSDSFINSYMKNPLIPKEILGLKDYGNIFTNNILNDEQIKQINDIENINNNKINNFCNTLNDKRNTNYKMIYDFSKSNYMKLPIINYSQKIKKNYNDKNVKEEENKPTQNIFNLPKVPSFLNDNESIKKDQNNKYMNINNSIYKNNIININNIPILNNNGNVNNLDNNYNKNLNYNQNNNFNIILLKYFLYYQHNSSKYYNINIFYSNDSKNFLCQKRNCNNINNNQVF